MTHLPFFQIDAFAKRPFSGNPAAVIPLTAWLDDDQLQAIAAENNLSETAFFVPDETDEADYELRWFTPILEVAMCGHATLASGHAILSKEDTRQAIRFRTRTAGILSVVRDGKGYALSLPAWKPEPRPLPTILAALGLGQVVETLWHPRGYALVVVDNEATVRALRPDFRRLADEGNVLTIISSRGEDTDVVSRAFAPGSGIDEDPVTGSAHAVLVPYWSQKLDRLDLTAFQASSRGGYLACRMGTDDVVLSGFCVTVIEGHFLLTTDDLDDR